MVTATCFDCCTTAPAIAIKNSVIIVSSGLLLLSQDKSVGGN